MLRERSREFNFLQRFFDSVVVAGSWSALYFFRFHMFEGNSGPEYTFLKAGVALIILSALIFSRQGLYESYRLATRQTEALNILKANLTSVLAFIVVLYFLTDSRISRVVISGYAIFSTFLLVAFRMLVRSYLRKLRSQGRNLRNFLLVGNGKILEDFLDQVKLNKDAGIRFVGWMDSKGAAGHHGIQDIQFEFEQARRDLQPDQIIISYMDEESAKVQKFVKEYFNDVVPIMVLPDLSYSFIGHQVEYVSGLPAYVLNQPDFSDFDLVLKRGLDFFSALLGLLVISPLLLSLAALVKLTSSGPIFFAQERVGLDGKRFRMWKFRSMKVSAESESTWTVENDPRRTKFGSFLRKTSFDELPQLWNVLVGDMSLVGPRPEQPHYVDKFRHEIPAYMLRHKMKAGITGWAQVNGWRGDTSLHERISCDLYYIKNWSLWLDIKILFLTFWRGIGAGY